MSTLRQIMKLYADVSRHLGMMGVAHFWYSNSVSTFTPARRAQSGTGGTAMMKSSWQSAPRRC